ncbi:MAG: hypothetical protein OEY33_06830 [Bdellovibrionales bacterium]|jgi:hypothetical protein|nr:hypothetical protein [Bdellovibrionales bacterium]
MIELGGAVLYSGNKQLLGQFLGQLLECEMEISGEDLYLKGPGYHFWVKDSSSVNRENGPSFIFDVKEKNQLEEIKNKFQFINYSLTHGEKVWADEVKINRTSSGYSMEVIDPDGRIWLFTCKDDSHD